MYRATVTGALIVERVMNSEQYVRTLEEFFQGEVTGEALFHALAEALEDPERRYQMRVFWSSWSARPKSSFERISGFWAVIHERAQRHAHRYYTGKGSCSDAVGQSDAHLRT
jgi:hypothetical protein